MENKKIKPKKSLGLAQRSFKRSLGQNFLRDPKILKKIADSAKIEKTDTVVEVGPGEGGLTKLLLEQAKKVIAIEKDSEMVLILKDLFEKEIKEGKLEIIEGDVLNLEPEESSCSLSTHKILLNFCSARSLDLRKAHSQDFPLVPASNYVLVGNIPYYITGALFKKALEAENPPKSITFVVQKEVAERIMARDGKESILSISIKVYGKPEYGGIIKAGSFYPKPKVDSGIISVRNINRERFVEVCSEKSLEPLAKTTPVRATGVFRKNIPNNNLSRLEQNFFKILKAGFAHKRKLLIKNLAEMSKLKEIFEKCGISEKVRAEDLKVEDWIAITKELT